MRRLLLVASLALIFVAGCGDDGKLNLMVVYWGWGDSDDPPPVSSAEIPEVSSSSLIVQSSSSQEPPLSSAISLSSSSSVPTPSSSSSTLPIWSSPSGIPLVNVPPLEAGGPDVQKGWASRYWDGCKPTCAWPSNIWTQETGNPVPYAIARNCDIHDREMPSYYLDPRTGPDNPSDPPRYFGTGCAKMTGLSSKKRIHS